MAHYRKRGAGWQFTVDVGEHTAQRCVECARRAGWLGVRRYDECPRCGGALVECTERRQETGTRRTKREAQAAAERLQVAVKGQDYRPARQITVGEWLQEFLEGQRLQVKASTIASYRHTIECYLAPRVGAVPLNKLTPSHLERMYTDIAEHGGRNGSTLSLTTVRYCHAVMRRALQ